MISGATEFKGGGRGPSCNETGRCESGCRLARPASLPEQEAKRDEHEARDQRHDLEERRQTAEVPAMVEQGTRPNDEAAGNPHHRCRDTGCQARDAKPSPEEVPDRGSDDHGISRMDKDQGTTLPAT